MASSLQEIIFAILEGLACGGIPKLSDKNTAMVVLRNLSQELCKCMDFCAQILNYIELVYDYIPVNCK